MHALANDARTQLPRREKVALIKLSLATPLFAAQTQLFFRHEFSRGRRREKGQGEGDGAVGSGGSGGERDREGERGREREREREGSESDRKKCQEKRLRNHDGIIGDIVCERTRVVTFLDGEQCGTGALGISCFFRNPEETVTHDSNTGHHCWHQLREVRARLTRLRLRTSVCQEDSVWEVCFHCHKGAHGVCWASSYTSSDFSDGDLNHIVSESMSPSVSEYISPSVSESMRPTVHQSATRSVHQVGSPPVISPLVSEFISQSVHQ